MKKKATAMVLASTVICCAAAQHVAASGINGRVHISTRVQAGQIQAATNSVAQLGSVKLKESNLGSTLNVNNQVVIGGPTNLQRGAQVHMASLDLDNARIGGTAELQMNVNVQKGVFAGQDSDIGLGGVEITADDNYNPSGSNSWTSLRGSNNMYHPLPVSPTIPINLINNNNTTLTMEELEQLNNDLAYAYMSECAYGENRCNDSLKGKLEALGCSVITSEDNLPFSSIEYAQFHNNLTGQLAIAFRGTETNFTKSVPDWFANEVSRITTVAGSIHASLYKKQVEVFADELAKNIGAKNIVFVGHSKGGGEALWASKKTGAKAVVFNPRGEAGTGQLFDSGQARGYYLEGEFLHYTRLSDSTKLVEIPYDNPSDSSFSRHGMNLVINRMEALSKEAS